MSQARSFPVHPSLSVRSIRSTPLVILLGLAFVAGCGGSSAAPRDAASGGASDSGGVGSGGSGTTDAAGAGGTGGGGAGGVATQDGGALDASGGTTDAVSPDVGGGDLAGGARDGGDAPLMHPADSVVWMVDNLDAVGGHPVTKVGNPMVIETPAGKAVQFNGVGDVGDALFVDAQPIAGFTKFTAEVIFRPDAGGSQAQRWFHMQGAGADRVLFEHRVEGNSWFLVSFVQSGNNIGRLWGVAFPHPVGVWHHAAIVVDGTTMKHYINGVYENVGPCPQTEGCTPADVQVLAAPFPLRFSPIGNGNTSMGSRITRVAFLKGAIRMARFTPRALTPAEFLPHD